MTTHTTHDGGRLVSLVVLFVFGTLVASLATGVVATQSTVEVGSTISTGGTYELAPDASNTTASTGLTVTGSPVEIAGGGTRLSGPGTRGSIGIDAPDASTGSSLVVRNLTLSEWGTGIRTSNVSTVTIRDTVVRSNHTGVRIDGAETVRIENATLVVDDGTVFEDVGRVVLENSSIRTDDAQSITAVNTTVYVGRNVSMTGGVRVRRGVVELPDDTVTPTAEAEPKGADVGTATPPTGVDPIRRGEGGGGVGGGSGPAGGVSEDAPTTPVESPLADQTTETPNTATPTVGDEPETVVESKQPSEGREPHGRDETSSRSSSPTTKPDSTVATAQADGGDDSTGVGTPGFGVVVTVFALGLWAIRRSRAD